MRGELIRATRIRRRLSRKDHVHDAVGSRAVGRHRRRNLARNIGDLDLAITIDEIGAESTTLAVPQSLAERGAPQVGLDQQDALPDRGVGAREVQRHRRRAFRATRGGHDDHPRLLSLVAAAEVRAQHLEGLGLHLRQALARFAPLTQRAAARDAGEDREPERVLKPVRRADAPVELRPREDQRQSQQHTDQAADHRASLRPRLRWRRGDACAPDDFCVPVEYCLALAKRRVLAA